MQRWRALRRAVGGGLRQLRRCRLRGVSMLFHRLGLGFSPSTSNPDRRHCYVRPGALDQLLETPGVLELLAEELGAAPAPATLSLVEQLESIRRRAIHLAVTHSPVRGLSLEEIIVVTAYASSRFDHTAWKRELVRQPNPAEVSHACQAWLMQRASSINTGRRFGKPRWPLVGCTATDALTSDPFMVAVAPFADHRTLHSELERLASEAGFAHEHYVACSPATALAYLHLQAHSTKPPRWDSMVLDRRLRTLGLGLLLLERDGVLLYLPARYQPPPRS
jgi:hypothetical protein